MIRAQNEGILSEKKLNASRALEEYFSKNSLESSKEKFDHDVTRPSTTSLPMAHQSLRRTCTLDTPAVSINFGHLFLTPIQFVKQLPDSKILIVDCRSQLDYSREHLRSAHNVNCRSKLIGRKLSTKALEEIEPSLSLALKSSDGVIIYDQCTTFSSEEQIRALPIHLVVQSVRRSNKRVQIIQGGLEAMKSQYPHLIESSADCCPIGDHSTLDLKTPDAIDKENLTMTEIMPYIFVGNIADSQNIELLKKNGITHIINATPDAPIQNGTEFRTIRIPVLDLPSENIQQHFEKTIEFIDEAMSSKENKVLVHCAAGISRSPTLVLAYMIKRYHFSLDEAVKKMRQLRSIIDPNLSFIGQLRCWEKRCRLDNEITEEVRTIRPSSSLQFSSSRSKSSSRCFNSTQTNNGEAQSRPDSSIIVK